MRGVDTAVGRSGPAISLTKVQETAPALVSLYKSAGVSLRSTVWAVNAPPSTSSSTTPAR